MDYQGNSKKDKLEKTKPEKKVERVVTGEVLVQKKSIGKKFKDIFVEADFRSVASYLVVEVMIPSVKNLIVDAGTKGIHRMIYGESAVRRMGFNQGPRVTYQTPVNRSPLSGVIPNRTAPAVTVGPRGRATKEDFILSTKEEAENVLEHMIDIIDTYDVASVGDLYNLVGWPTDYTDEKWGWTSLHNVQIIQVREGYLIDFPPAGAIG